MIPNCNLLTNANLFNIVVQCNRIFRRNLVESGSLKMCDVRSARPSLRDKTHPYQSRIRRDQNIKWNSSEQVDQKPAFEVMDCDALLVRDDFVIFAHVGCS